MKRDPEYTPTRYKGRPLLAILDQFVLSVALDTPKETEDALKYIVDKTWKSNLEWKAAVIHQLELSPTILDSLKDMWIKNQKIAKEHNVSLSPWQFAKMITDKNFAPLIEGRG